MKICAISPEHAEYIVKRVKFGEEEKEEVRSVAYDILELQIRYFLTYNYNALTPLGPLTKENYGNPGWKEISTNLKGKRGKKVGRPN